MVTALTSLAARALAAFPDARGADAGAAARSLRISAPQERVPALRRFRRLALAKPRQQPTALAPRGHLLAVPRSAAAISVVSAASEGFASLTTASVEAGAAAGAGVAIGRFSSRKPSAFRTFAKLLGGTAEDGHHIVGCPEPPSPVEPLGGASVLPGPDRKQAAA